VESNRDRASVMPGHTMQHPLAEQQKERKLKEMKSEDDHRKIYGQSTRACFGLGLLTSHPSQKGWGGGASPTSVNSSSRKGEAK